MLVSEAHRRELQRQRLHGSMMVVAVEEFVRPHSSEDAKHGQPKHPAARQQPHFLVVRDAPILVVPAIF